MWLLVSSVQVVHAQSVVLEWKLYSSRGAAGQNQNQHDAALPLPRWTSAVVHIDNPQISYTAKVSHPSTPGSSRSASPLLFDPDWILCSPFTISFLFKNMVDNTFQRDENI